MFSRVPHVTPLARKALERLAADFNALDAKFPTARHVLITVDDSQAESEADYCAARAAESEAEGVAAHVLFDRAVYRHFDLPQHGRGWLIDRDGAYGGPQFEESWPLACRAVELLTEAGLLDSAAAPDPSEDPCFFEATKAHFFGRWFAFLHCLAGEADVAVSLGARAEPFVEHFPLPDGVVARTLDHPFRTAAAIIEEVLAAAREQRNSGDGNPPEPPGQASARQSATGNSRETPAGNKATKPKRSTEGEGRAKCIAALTKHHKYADGSCLNLESIGNNELSRAAVVSRSTASQFFGKEFRGHNKYKALCRDPGGLAAALKLLNGEFSPHHLYGQRPAGKDTRDDD